MEKNEVRDILTVLKVNYPQSFKHLTIDEKKAYLDLWTEAFKDDSAELVAMAVKSIIYGDTREFAPNIAQVKEKMYSLKNAGNELTEQEAWNLVLKACKNGIHGAREEFEKLPPVVQTVIGSPSVIRDYATMDINQLNTVASSNFMRSYRARAKYVKETEKLPNEIKALIGMVDIKRIN